MPLSRRLLLGAAAGAALARPALLRAQGATPIRIGEINSYTTQPWFGDPYRLGWEMAVAHINDLGGLNGRKLEVIARDDSGDPATAARLAAELLSDQKVDLLAGGLSSEVGLAISAVALANKRLYVAGAPKTDALVWQQGNRYTYRIAPSTSMLTEMVVDGAAALPAKTLLTSWATVAPGTADGRAAVAAFRQLAQARRPGIRFVGEQFPAPGQFDPSAIVQRAWRNPGRTRSSACWTAPSWWPSCARAPGAGCSPTAPCCRPRRAIRNSSSCWAVTCRRAGSSPAIRSAWRTSRSAAPSSPTTSRATTSRRAWRR